ncbi:MAG: AmmeMemoRadiSam system protein B [Thermodesulfobacteriota bacterium]
MIRKPCVANQFYPADPSALKTAVEEYIRTGCFACTAKPAKKPAEEKAVAVIAPHAGYMYSGLVAGCVYSSIEVPDTVLLIGPNHTGLGEKAAVMDCGRWSMPFGKTEVDEELTHLVLDHSPLFSPDAAAHMSEHSLEVQLPFLYVKNPSCRIAPITLMHARTKECVEMGRAIANAIKAYKREVLIVVSSDMNHYESEEITSEKDKLAIDKILSLDPEGLLKVTASRNITMCGAVPAAVALVASKILGASNAKLLVHATSGEVSKDFDHVVGYAGIIINGPPPRKPNA